MDDALITDAPLPVGSSGRNSTAWFGMLCLIATEGSLFAYLLFSYAYSAAQNSADWLPTLHPSLKYGLPGTIVLFASSATIWWSERGMKSGRRFQHLSGLAATILLGLAFIVLELLDWRDKDFSLSSRAYGSFYFTITGFHLLHVIVGISVLVAVLCWSLAGCFTERRHMHVTISGVYWHFVDVVWIFVFSTFFIVPYVVAS
ncbi:cytochrome c oxidase subunit 3 [Novosphingopyxis sp.]|uniref:cytochrome c oxidase subunit 3 n=1 Tax=Novosphingopyxis sp. TaxID=2709690 RepID=UPI003B5C6BC0